MDKLPTETGELRLRFSGPFAVQPNSDTRRVEYPWAYEAMRITPGLDVVELGGALSGFQFVLAKSGCRVVNVDPGEHEQTRWELAMPLNAKTMRRLNEVFDTKVELRSGTLDTVNLATSSADRVVSISTIEHIAADQIPHLMSDVARVLRPGGLCVLTIDMFLDLEPFTDKTENAYGTNIDVRALVESSGMDLIVGNTAQLVGYPAFDPNNILRNLGDYFIGAGYPVCAQALVLQKR